MPEIDLDAIRRALTPRAPGAHWAPKHDEKKEAPKKRSRFDIKHPFSLGLQPEDDVELIAEEDRLAANRRLQLVPQLGLKMHFWVTLAPANGCRLHVERLLRTNKPWFRSFLGWQAVLQLQAFVGQQVRILYIPNPDCSGRKIRGGTVRKVTRNGHFWLDIEKPLDQTTELVLAFPWSAKEKPE
jgi:hypothetical protein